LPLIVDAAAEEDLNVYYELGADLVIYSGAKAIEGPSSGLVIGTKVSRKFNSIIRITFINCFVRRSSISYFLKI
ncbi:hypothetical protein ACTPEF_24595, partial [Clostridioides difficile]